MKQINNTFFADKGYKLISASAITSLLNGDYLKIDSAILENAKNYGIAIGNALIEKIKNPKYIDDNSLVDKAINTLYKAIKDLKPITAEKLINNNYFVGYLDFDCENCFVELKVRSSSKYSLDNIIQCKLYEIITGKPFKLFIYNKKDDKLNIYTNDNIDIDIKEQANQILRKVIELMEIYNGITK